MCLIFNKPTRAEDVSVDTPYIDGIAKEGVSFTSDYATSLVCTPSRASILTGLYLQATRAPTNNQVMYEETETFAELLRRNDYAT
jgi:uncharacterized sulfatase